MSDSRILDLWTTKEMMQVAAKFLGRANGSEGLYQISDLTYTPVVLTSTLCYSNSNVASQNNSGAQQSFPTRAFVIGNAPGYDTIGGGNTSTFEPDSGSKSVLSGTAFTSCFIGRIDIMAPSATTLSWSASKINANTMLRTYQGRFTSICEHDLQQPGLVIGTGMAMGIPYANINSPQGFQFYGFQINVIS